MNKTKIEWATHVWNPVIGCKRGCSYCYAKKINDRFKYTPDFSKPELFMDKLLKSKMPNKPSRIFVNSMSDICYWNKSWMRYAIQRIGYNPQHTFIFLTKDSSCYLKYDFPKNCWLGITEDGKNGTLKKKMKNDIFLKNFQDHITFVSVEPLLGNNFNFSMNFDWLIIGGLTPKSVHTEKEVVDLLAIARYCKIPVFLKDNLKYPKIIKEFPKLI